MTSTCSSPSTFVPPQAATPSLQPNLDYFNFPSPMVNSHPGGNINNSNINNNKNSVNNNNSHNHLRVPQLNSQSIQQMYSKHHKLPELKLTPKKPLSPTFIGTTPNSSKFFNVTDLGAIPITSIQDYVEITKAGEKPGNEVMIIDLRPFSSYNTSRLFNALSICVPSTLLKRSSFTISNISKTMTPSQQEELDSKLESMDSLKIVFYDSNSKEDHSSFQLYQLIKKFKDTLPEFNKEIKLYFVNEGFNLFKKNQDHSTQETHIDFKKFKASKSPDVGTFSEFTLPSNDPSSSFLMSLKANQQTPYINKNTQLNVPTFNHQDNIPTWLQKFANTKAISTIVSNFIKIEKTENQRITNAFQRRLSASSSSRTNSPRSPNPSAFQFSSASNNNFKPMPSPDGSYLFNGSENGFKNRYSNVLPYEHSRVKVIQTPITSNVSSSNNFFSGGSPNIDADGSLHGPNPSIQRSLSFRADPRDDYFNANYISVPQINVTSHYIATQAPLPSTVDDFWKVVWHNGTEIIISLTNLDENGVKKSDVYWNNAKNVKLLEEIKNFHNMKDLVARKIEITKNGEKRIVTQLHYVNWPDHGIVNHQELIDLIEVKDKLVTNKDSPILVHCSAGCGRTGTFITIDLIIEAFKKFKNKKVENIIDSQGSHTESLQEENHDDSADGNVTNIFNTEEDLIYFAVQQLRKQRISMVQSLDQFVLCYETVLFYFHQAGY